MASKKELLAIPFSGAICILAKSSSFRDWTRCLPEVWLLQVKEDESVKLIFKYHLQRPVASGFKLRGFPQDSG